MASAAFASMDRFVYNKDTSNTQWPRWKIKFENFFAMTQIKLKKVTSPTDPTLIDDPESIKTRRGFFLHGAGEKALDIYMATDNYADLTYEAMLDIFDRFFITQDDTTKIFLFKCTKPNEGEHIADYINRLKIAGAQASIAPANLPTEILHVIAIQTKDSELRKKCLSGLGKNALVRPCLIFCNTNEFFFLIIH